MTPCSEQRRITRMETKLENIEKILVGNGQPGLHDTVIKLNENVANLVSSIEKQKTQRRWLLTVTISLLSLAVGLFIEVLKSM